MDIKQLNEKLWQGKLTRRDLMKNAGMLGMGAMAAHFLSEKVAASPNAIFEPQAKKWRCGVSEGSFLKSSWEGRGVDTMKFLGDILGIEVVPFDGGGSADGQRKSMDDMATQKWDFAAIHPWAIDAFVDPINSIISAGTPFFQLDTIISSDPAKVNYVTFLEPDNMFMGSVVTKQLVDALGGKGEIVHTQGMLTHTGAQGRAKGFHSVVDGLKDIKVVDETPGDWDTVKTRALWEDLLVKYPNLAGGMFHNDDMALAAYGAVKAAGKEKQVKLVGVDGMQPAIEAVLSGQLLSTVINPTGRIHGGCMWIGWLILTGKVKAADVPKFIRTDAPVVDAKNGPGFLFLANNLMI